MRLGRVAQACASNRAMASPRVSGLPLDLRERVLALRTLEWQQTRRPALLAASASATTDQLMAAVPDLLVPAPTELAVSRAMRALHANPRGHREARETLALAVALGGGGISEPNQPWRASELGRCLDVLNLCARHGWSSTGAAVFRGMRDRGIPLAAALPRLLEASAASPGARDLLRWLAAVGVPLTRDDYARLFCGCSRHGADLARMSGLWAQMRALGGWPSPWGLDKFVKGACECDGGWRLARDAMAEAAVGGVSVPVRAWRVALRRCSKEHGTEEDVLFLLDKVAPRTAADFSVLLLYHAEAQRTDPRPGREADVLERMAREGVQADESTYAALVMLRRADPAAALRVVEEARGAGVAFGHKLFTACACAMWARSQVGGACPPTPAGTAPPRHGRPAPGAPPPWPSPPSPRPATPAPPPLLHPRPAAVVCHAPIDARPSSGGACQMGQPRGGGGRGAAGCRITAPPGQERRTERALRPRRRAHPAGAKVGAEQAAGDDRWVAATALRPESGGGGGARARAQD